MENKSLNAAEKIVVRTFYVLGHRGNKKAENIAIHKVFKEITSCQLSTYCYKASFHIFERLKEVSSVFSYPLSSGCWATVPLVWNLSTDGPWLMTVRLNDFSTVVVQKQSHSVRFLTHYGAMSRRLNHKPRSTCILGAADSWMVLFCFWVRWLLLSEHCWWLISGTCPCPLVYGGTQFLFDLPIWFPSQFSESTLCGLHSKTTTCFMLWVDT